MKEKKKRKQGKKLGQYGEFYFKYGLGSHTKYARNIKWVHKNLKYTKMNSWVPSDKKS